MALRVWLPLNGNLNNKGLTDIGQPVVSSWTEASGGKLGQCYKGYAVYHLGSDFLQNKWTIAAWVKADSAWSQYNDMILCKNTSTSTDCQFYLSIVGGSKLNIGVNLHNQQYEYAYNFAVATWYHIAASFDGANYYLYLNGELVKTGADTSTYTTPALNLTINGRSSSAEGQFTGNSKYVNDVRVYDECLSYKQIKDIYKGLICHYKLDNRYNTKNLIVNGYGELGSLGWYDANKISTTEIPSGVDDVKASFYGGNSTATTEYISIIPYHSYTISAYIKSSGPTSGTTYPSILPYDVDKNFIAHHHTRIGFDTKTATTLTQPLSPGDTVIYATDLSQWSTATNNYYYHAAIFGYKDSTGYVYPDLEYTQDSPVFGSYSDKTHIDKTNNTITLNSAYTGAYRPAGTVICQSTEGSTYYYPFGGLKLADLSDWVFKTSTFTPKYDNRLRWAKYFRYSTYGNTYQAAIKLIDNTIDSNPLIDTSGYSRLTSTTGMPTYSIDSPRFDGSTYFNGTSYYQTTSPSTEAFTISFWVKWNVIPSGQSVVYVDYKSRTGFGLMSSGMLCSSGGINSKTFSKANITVNTWYHVVIVNPDGLNTSTNRDLYINGVKQTALTSTSNWTFGIDYLQIGKRSTTSDGFNGCINDFRMYCTILSEDDILTLYKTSSIIDNEGNVYPYELLDTKVNIFKTENIQKYTPGRSGNGYGQIVTRAGENAIAINPSTFYQKTETGKGIILRDEILPNTQYFIDAWIDGDDVVYNNENRYQGLKVVYTDNTVTNLTVKGDQTNPKGFQHVQLLTDKTKSVYCIEQTYYVSIPNYYRWDTVICPVNKHIINKNGQWISTDIITNSNIAKIHQSGNTYATDILEI